MSFLSKVEDNIAKVQSTPKRPNNDARRSNGGFSRPPVMPASAIDPSVPPLRLGAGLQLPRQFPGAPNAKPVVLAPNSSPDQSINSGSSYVPHQSHFGHFAYNPAAYSSSQVGMRNDPFMASTLNKSSTKARPAPQSSYEPPRKKQNLGDNSQIIYVNDTPESSPEVGFKSNKNVVYSPLDEESPPRRIKRRDDMTPFGHPASPSVPRLHMVNSPVMSVTSLKSAFPQCSDLEVKRAWQISGEDYYGASQILQSIVQNKEQVERSYTVSIAAQKAQEQKEKELAKQRKNKSAIYASRNGPASQAASAQPKRNADDSDSDGDNFKADGFDSDASDADDGANDSELEQICMLEALEYFNTAQAEELVMMIACTPEQANTIISMRPFHTVDDIERKMVRRSGVTSKLFENYKDLLKGYRAVDAVLQRCEKIGQDTDAILEIWQKFSTMPRPEKEETLIHLVDDPSPTLSVEMSPEERKIMDRYIWDPPKSLAKDVTLKEYQMLGLNWLHLLYSRGHSCILADEMGLGKTIQVIAFLTHLKDVGIRDKFLIVVPASTLENWIREFKRFSPEMRVVSYYGTISERSSLRHELLDALDTWDVLVTTYNFAQGGGNDGKFFKKVSWLICVYDEGHVLKNYQSQRYQALMKIRARWRLLLTGTPLQNNLQELLSLMNFILPRMFTDVAESFRQIFKVKASAQAGLLAHDRVSRAKRMMTPFVLRRRKDQVLKELPKKTERIEWCDMTELQKTIYRQTLQRSRRVLMEQSEEEDELAIAEAAGQKGRPKKKKIMKEQQQDLSSNVLMDLRKSTSHPMLFRRLYDDDKVKAISKACLAEPEFQESRFELVVEDMSVMTDAEIHHFCKRYKSVRKFALDEARHLEAGKVNVLLRLLKEYIGNGRRVLIFSQFTQILDILKTVLEHEEYKYLILTGSTAVDERQGLVDDFNEDEDYKVFLLSTKAGGMGINLTAASVVITYDQDFNPHNDLQAADRAYRIGQQRDVDVIKLITKGTIEEDILQLALTKLQLDEAVAGDEEASKQTENEIKKSLIQRLRKKLEQDDDTTPDMKTETEPESATAITIETEGETEAQPSQDASFDLLSSLPALLAIASSPPATFLEAEETPPVTQSPTPLPTPGEREQKDDIIMVDD